MTEEFSASRSSLPRFRQPTVADLCVQTVAVKSSVSNIDVWDLFTKHRELVSLPVVEGNAPIGLICRNIFMSQMSKLYHREVFGKKSCIAFMDKEPLIVDADMSIEALAFRAVEFGERALADGFLVTRDGVLCGVGFGLDLMNVVANLQAEKNRQIMQSIDYASVIQMAMLRTSNVALAESIEDAQLVWQPRDVVGGDFYHFSRHADGWFAAIADCTGHGVPGAFMTLIASAELAKALHHSGPRDPATLLSAVNCGIKEVLGQTGGQEHKVKSNDGMDAAFLWFDHATRKLAFAGARIAMLVLDPLKDNYEIIDGERMGVGYVESPLDFKWANKIVDVAPGSLLFVTTDGLVDQIGGPKEIAFGKRRIRECLMAQRSRTTKEIGTALLDEFQAWQDRQQRRDDVTFFCVRP